MNTSFIRKVSNKIKRRFMPQIAASESVNIIRTAIYSSKPFAFARFGAVEIKTLLYVMKPSLRFFLRRYVYTNMPRNAGFFPCNDEMLHLYFERMVSDMQQIDYLGCWRPEEIFFRHYLSNAMLLSCFPITTLHPHKLSWTPLLENKKVLVVHPFAETIERQYCNFRDKLHNSDTALPVFAKLETVKAANTIDGDSNKYETWFDALNEMEREIEKKDFDIALIGCGAYGFCLATFVKRLGKQALHLGGDLQLYFGIKGKRWDSKGYYNEYWVRPSDKETPKLSEKVEGGCYW